MAAATESRPNPFSSRLTGGDSFSVVEDGDLCPQIEQCTTSRLVSGGALLDTPVSWCLRAVHTPLYSTARRYTAGVGGPVPVHGRTVFHVRCC